MPLTGVICCQTGKPESFDRCLEASLRGRPAPCDHPFALIAFMANKDQAREGVGLSATQLTGCARKVVLQRDYAFADRPENMWNMFRGALGHEMVGRYAELVPDGLMEVRVAKEFEVPFEGEVYPTTLTGQPDWSVPDYGPQEEGMVEDFKSTKRKVAVITDPKEEHREQVTIYAELMDGGYIFHTGDPIQFPVSIGRITYFDMEGSKTVQFRIEGESEARTAFIVERLTPFVRERVTGDLPDLLPSRVVKSKRTSATQVHRHPLCGYCSVREICDRLWEQGR